MSNIYIQEPPTYGKVLIVTSAGDIDVELWSKEAPKACRNFVQLCLESYYDGTVFHRLVPEFVVQGGDPTGTGEGGESIYGQPFKDEIHSRLRFNRRGLVAMANAGKDDNGSQFFFTLGATPELQGKHTIFGKVVGDTVYNMLKLGEGETDENERPLHCYKIIKTEILSNPFDDIVPRVLKAPKEKKEKKKTKEKGVKNLKLLSFGEEAAEDEEETFEASKAFSSKKKSSHDLLNDPKLSSEPAVTACNTASPQADPSPSPPHHTEGDDPNFDLGESKEDELLRRRAEIQKEIDELKADSRKNKEPKNKSSNGKTTAQELEDDPSNEKNEILEEYKSNLVKYGKEKVKIPTKGPSRESFTMQLLAKFQDKLKNVKEKVAENEAEVEEKSDDETWLGHNLKFEQTPVLARDANTKTDDWFDITDPRNPINKRRREESKKALSRKVPRMRD